jgi:hypothetical protein
MAKSSYQAQAIPVKAIDIVRLGVDQRGLAAEVLAKAFHHDCGAEEAR